MDKKKKHKYDMFICDGFNAVAFELKYLNLVGLLCGQNGKWEWNPEYQYLKELDKKIEIELEEELLNRDYYFWCKIDRKYKSIKVKKLINDGIAQLNAYLNVIKKGNSSQNNVGIFDERILVNVDGSYIMGYLIICIGSQRIIVRKSNIKRCNFTFSINK